MSLQTIQSSISLATLRQYSAYLKMWWNFCIVKEHNPFIYTLDMAMTFLSTQFQTGISYSTINSQHAALSLIFSIEYFDKAILKRFLKGIYNQKPSRPKYQTTWDPQPVLDHLSTLYPLTNITILQLSMKLVTLLALITGHRLQTLSCIRLQNIIRFQDRLEIRITDNIKTSSSRNFQPVLVIPYFRENPNLCLASAIDFYVIITKDIRPTGTDQLLLTIKKPIHPVSTQRLSKWIKMTLSASGIDTELFSSYSTRHAATSAACRAGVSIEIIRSTAGWTQKSEMFARFYNRPLCNDATIFAKAVVHSASNNNNNDSII